MAQQSTLLAFFSLLLYLSTLPTTSATSKPYLSSNPRQSPPRQFPFFSYSRHPSSLPPFNPLHGVENVLVHRGIPDDLDQISGIQLGLQGRDDSNDDGVINGNGNGSFTRMYHDKILWVGLGVHDSGDKSGSRAVKEREWVEDLEKRRKGDDDGDDDGGDSGDDGRWGGKGGWGGSGKGENGNGNGKYGSGNYGQGSGDDDGDGDYGRGGEGSEYHKSSGGSKDYGDDDDDNGGIDDSGSRGSRGSSSYDHKSQSGNSKWSDEGNDDDEGNDARKGSNPGKYGTSSYGGGKGNSYGSSSGDRGGDDGQWHKGAYGDDGKYNSGDNGRKNNDSDDYDGNDASGKYNTNDNDSSYNSDDYSSQDTGPDSNDDTPNSNDDYPSHSSPSSSHSPYPSSSSYSGGGAHRLAQTQYSNPSHSDCARLMQFYRSMTSPPSSSDWTRNDGWADEENTNCCGWYGVSCDAAQRVTGLDLGGNGLKGALGDTLFAVNAIVRIDISNNAITSLPDRFASLPKLTHFSASSCNLTGSIPQSLLSSSSIINIDLSTNQLSGPVQLSSASLYTLSLQSNQLSSISIQDTASTSGLGKVDIGSNAFMGNLPDLSGSTNLSVFDASFNNTGPIFDLSHLTNLTRFDVRSNSLTGSFPTFTSQTKLTSLYLSTNSLSGAFPTGPAPSTLQSCYIMPSNSPSPCPSPSDLSNPNSWAAKCHLTCPKGSNTNNDGGLTKGAIPSGSSKNGAGIPVSPLPGESLGGQGGGAGIQAQGVAMGGTTSPPQNPIPVAGGVQWGAQPVPEQGQIKGQGFTPSPPIATVRGKAVIGNSGLMGDISGSSKLNTGFMIYALTTLPIISALIWA